MTSTTQNRLIKLLAVLFWLVVWQVASLIIGEEIFLPSPLAVLLRLASIVTEDGFWGAVCFTLRRIILGFALSAMAALLFAALSYKLMPARLLLDPLVKAVRAVPVASIIILVLVWVRSRNLSVVISFLMVFPIVYTNVLEGLEATDPLLLEMAESYRLKRLKALRYIYLPSIVPYLTSAVSTALGLAWKSGIAAEVIGLPMGSIGENLYLSKVYLMMPDLFAWTVVIVILAFVFEKVFLFLVKEGLRRAVR